MALVSAGATWGLRLLRVLPLEEVPRIAATVVAYGVVFLVVGSPHRRRQPRGPRAPVGLGPAEVPALRVRLARHGEPAYGPGSARDPDHPPRPRGRAGLQGLRSTRITRDPVLSVASRSQRSKAASSSRRRGAGPHVQAAEQEGEDVVEGGAAGEVVPLQDLEVGEVRGQGVGGVVPVVLGDEGQVGRRRREDQGAAGSQDPVHVAR